jgi:O-antigen ligase
MMLLLATLVVTGVVFTVVALHKGLWPAITIALLATLIFIPRKLTSNSIVENTGLAGSAPDLYSYSFVFFAASIVLLLSKTKPVSQLFFPFIILTLAGTFFVWESTDLVRAGLLQLLLALVAWQVGAHLGHLAATDMSFAKFICGLIVVIISLETVMCLAQLAGIPINSMDPSTAALMGNRVNGSMNHPNNLGKVLLFLIILLSPFLRSADKQLQKRSLAGILLAFLPLALTGGRAAFIAAIIVVVLTGALSRGVKGRFAMPVGVFLLVLPFLDTLWQRFEDDPEGGSRGYLLEIALRQIAAHPWEGIGPNSYVSFVGLTDALTATGLPVHNTFLLTAAELGIPVALALFMPLVIVLVKAWKSRSTSGHKGASAAAYLAAAPAWILVAATGWGMLSTSILPLWFLTLGFISSPFMLPSEPKQILIARKRLDNPKRERLNWGGIN